MAGELVKANIAALAYHAGLKDDQRSMVQQRWVLEDRCKVRSWHTGTSTLSLVECTISLVLILLF